jgi:hypothetical protein
LYKERGGGDLVSSCCGLEPEYKTLAQMTPAKMTKAAMTNFHAPLSGRSRVPQFEQKD